MVKHNLRGWLIVGLLSLVVISGGCGLIKKIFIRPAPAMSDHPSLSNYQPDDIPIALNFRHLPQASRVYIDGDIRTAEIKYIANERMQLDDLTKWYERQMPLFGWEKTGDVVTQWKTVQAFTKKHGVAQITEVCEITIDKTSLEETYLVIKINAK